MPAASSDSSAQAAAAMAARWRRLGDAVAARISSLGLEHHEVASKAGFSNETLSKIVNARGSGYRPSTLRQLSEALKWPTDGLHRILDGEDPSALPDRDVAADASLKAGSADVAVWDDLVGDARARIEQANRASEAELVDMLARQLRNRGIRPELPAPNEPDYDLGWSTPDGERAIAIVKSVLSDPDLVLAAASSARVTAARLGEPVRAFALVDREPDESERMWAEQQLHVVILHPGDWSPLDTTQHTSSSSET